MSRDIQQEIIGLIKKTVKNYSPDKETLKKILLQPPSKESFGDLSCNIAFELSSKLKKSPFEIATEIVEELKRNISTSKLRNYLKEIKAEGAGFINFYFQPCYFYEYLNKVIRNKEKFFRANIGRGRKVLIEFVSANPTGPLTVAHARQAAVGDTLANILGFLGFRVKKEYYLNDEGRQIDILAESVKLRLRQLNAEKVDFPQDYYQGEYIYEIARQIKERNIIIQDYRQYAINWILDLIKKDLDDFRVNFDSWYSQKSLNETGKIKKVIEVLKKKDFVYENEGAFWIRSSQFGDDKDRVIIKKDGNYTYIASDIAYHWQKFRRRFHWLINLWGPDHHGYISRLKASIQALGYNPENLSIVIVQLCSIYKAGKLLQSSTRKAQYITLREILDEVGVDPARFFFLMRKTSSHLDFDLDLAKKQTPENPVYYIQYAHARIVNILKNFKERLPRNVNLSLLKEKEEIILIKKILEFREIIKICGINLEPYFLTLYLQELAEAFHRFYERHRVLGENRDLTFARLILIDAVRLCLSLGLKLMGVSQPERM